MTQTVDSVVPTKPRSPVLRGLYLVLGLLCLALAYPSIAIPGLPTFDLVLLAAFFFARSSDRFHDWLVNHPIFGKIVRGYREQGLTLRMKWVAAVAITVSIGFSIVFLLENSAIRTVLAAIWIYAIWFVFTRPTRPSR